MQQRKGKKQPDGNGRAEGNGRATVWQWKSNQLAMEEQRGKVQSSQLTVEEQKCGNGRAITWQWKSNQLAMEEQRGQRYEAKEVTKQ